jgi:poly(hydroxyalkanoate) depolymerase family esterase
MNRMTTAMAKVSALTRVGKLQEATEMIQSLLRPGTETPEPSPSSLTDITPAASPRPVQTARSFHSVEPAPRTGLGATLRRIAARGMPGPADLSRAAFSVPPGAKFLSLSHSSRHGTREYRLYVPSDHGNGPMPLVVMLHGCTQTPEDFANGTGMNELAEARGYLIAYPAQPSKANAQRCWNWFRPEDQSRDCGEPALIAGLVQDILRDHNGDPARTYIAGLSAGGAAAAIIADAYPEIFSGVGIHSGLPIGVARDVPSAFAAMRSGGAGKRRRSAIPTIVFHGTSDNTVHPDNGRAVAAQALNSYPSLQTSTESGIATGGSTFRRTRHCLRDGRSLVEQWEIGGMGHAWSGGQTTGSYTDARGPDASGQMLRFFLQHNRPG